MNYYPFHLGDYAAHTAHLEPMEDLAYRRMLDLYYRTEKPLPSDWRDVARLIRMRDYASAIEAVLSEFFTLSGDGWHNKRADEEIASMHAKQEQQATKDEHEAERMRRHRERRAALFADLREAGVVPPWDVSMKELLQMHIKHCNGPITDLQREQAISGSQPATAIPIPTPTPKKEEKARKRATPPQPEDVDAQVWTDWLALRNQKRAPVTATVLDSARTEAGRAGMSLEAFLRVWCARGSQGLEASWLKPHERPVSQPVRAGPDPAEVTRAMLDAQKQTPEERAAAEEARRRVMAGIRRIA